MLADDDLEALSVWLKEDMEFDQQFESKSPWEFGECLNPVKLLTRNIDFAPGADEGRALLWRGIHRLRFTAWAQGRFIAIIDMGTPVEGRDYNVRYADGSMAVDGKLPQSMMSGAAGRPMTELLPHPLFNGIRWSDDQSGDFLKGPSVDIALGVRPGKALQALAQNMRSDMLDAARQMSF